MLQDVKNLSASGITRQVGPMPLIVHLIYQMGIGGLENGLINLINNMPTGRYRHVVVCLKDQTEFSARIKVPGVEIICVNKREGKDWSHYLRLIRVLKRLRPALIHTRNLACIEGQLLAAIVGVRSRVHSEHGREMADLEGRNPKHILLRKLLGPLVGHYIAVSTDLQHWLTERIGVPSQHVTHIFNGVDSLHFHPRLEPIAGLGPAGFLCDNAFVIGSVGRMVEVKDFVSLVQAFLLLLTRKPERQSRLRLMLVGDGPSRQSCLTLLDQAGAAHLAWLPGSRPDIPQLMRAMDLFVLPSLAEGNSNTILEAMASGLAVVATRVGGNVDLVEPGGSGTLVPPASPARLADAIEHYYDAPGLTRCHGVKGRHLVLAKHSLSSMTNAYLGVYDAMLAQPLN
jgi:sugar transferase (PEP-CTERM/EpsH1 system associated)